MALHGEGEPYPTRLQAAVQAAKIELYTQWQTYRNGVHMDSDTFESIDFETLALAVIMGAGFSVVETNVNVPFPPAPSDAKAEPVRRSQKANANEVARAQAASTRRKPYGLDAAVVAEHGKQAQG